MDLVERLSIRNKDNGSRAGYSAGEDAEIQENSLKNRQYGMNGELLWGI